MKEPIFYKVFRPLLALFMIIKCNPKIINNEYIPKDGRCILAGNHTNYLDVFTLGVSTRRCIRYLSKKEITTGIKGAVIRWLGVIPVDRSIHDKSVIPTSIKYLNKEAILGIFPEGTINRTNDIIMPFKKGAVIMAIQAKAPIVPFAINGIYKRGKLKILFDKAYYPETDDVEKEVKVLENKVINLLKELKKQ